MAKRTGNNSLSGLMGYFDQIMVSQSLIQKTSFSLLNRDLQQVFLYKHLANIKAIRNGIPQPKLVLVTTFRFISI
jgi:hypothetical protein